MTDVNPILQPPVGPGGLQSFAQIWVEQWESRYPLGTQLAHLAEGIASIQVKRPRIDLCWRYYHGIHDNAILTEQLAHLERHFGVRIATMFTNYCGLLVDAPLSRLSVAGWKGSATAIQRAQRLWLQNALELESEEVHRHCLVGGEAFVIVWPKMNPLTGQRVAGQWDITLQDERTMHMVYGSTRRNDALVAVKVWQDGPRWRATLYYADEIDRFVTPELGPNAQCPQDVSVFMPDPLDPGGPHDLGGVPVVRFARTFDGRPKLMDLIPIQDRINKLTADKIVAAEYGAFPQRWALTHDDPPDRSVRAGPGAVWTFAPASQDAAPGSDSTPQRTQVGQFPVTELANYDQTIQREVEAFFTLGELPRHLLVSPSSMMTGEAIKADEGPMVAAMQSLIRLLSASWKHTVNLAGAGVDDVAWESVEVHNQLTQASVYTSLTQGGFPPQLAAAIALDLPQDQLDQLPSAPVLQPGAGQLTSPGVQVEGESSIGSSGEATDQT